MLKNYFLRLTKTVTSCSNPLNSFKKLNNFAVCSNGFVTGISDPDKFGDYGEANNKLNSIRDDVEDLKERKRQKLMDRRSAYYYIDMIKSHLSNYDYAKAVHLLEERMLKIDRVVPDSYIYDLLISYCGRKGDVKEAFRLYNEIKRRGYHVTGGQYTSLFNACANCDRSQYSLEVAQKVRRYLAADALHRPNIKNYNAMLKAFGRHGDLKTSLEIMDEILEKRGRVLDDTYNFLLQACISDKNSGFRHALLVWHRLLQNGTDPTIFSFNLILRATRDCGLGAAELHQSLIQNIVVEGSTRKLRKLSVEKDTSNYFALAIKPKSNSENHANIPTINNAVPTNGDGNASENSLLACVQKPDDVTINSLRDEEKHKLPNLLAITPQIGSVVELSLFSTAYHRLMLLGGVLGFLRTMDSVKIKPDMKTFTLLLEIIPSVTAIEEDLMNIAEFKKIAYDTKFFNMLIKKRCYRFDDAGAKEVLFLMQKNGVQPDLVTYGSLALGCRKRDDAADLIKGVHDAGFRLNSEILGPLVRHATYQQDMEYVRDILQFMKEDSVKPSPKLMVLLNDFMKKASVKLNST